MNKNYTSIGELLREVLECKLIDLVPYVTAIEISSEIFTSLEDPEPGIYLNGSIEPVFRSNQDYYIANNGEINLVTFNDIFNNIVNNTPLPNGDIYNEAKRFHMRRSIYNRLRNQFLTQPSIQTMACKAAVATVVEYLDSLNPRTLVAAREYYLGNFVKEDHKDLLEKDVFQEAFHDLYMEVKRFVGRDTWNYYFFKVVGTTLIIEKGLDFRIVEWHINELKKSEAYDHDTGGIPEEFLEYPYRY